MAIKVPFKPKVPQITLDLRGEQGNVFQLISLARKLSAQLGLDGEKIQKRMMTGDYYCAVNIFDAYFGDYVTLLVSEEIREELSVEKYLMS
ncbi:MULTISPECIES: hypothetical protein [Vibrio]|uniref:hypothetical protein n=1 Tax=Vibrio TaxID=662 RepID=UPI00040AABE3|nr:MULTISPECIES: hypothetical protein [Vibrio]EJM7154713.1 hypothetical protein [Vibrio parahaemolyticus]EJS2611070.1 hypothetical protein [Vibrio alginolyticus]MCA2452314.1 hypothetical protein [Vibrio alginolyticus]MCA2476380.1 hypothetical protein [Vibrio alginolyticus]MDW2156411.1 hypothetical protein [Vibrio sp. 2092]